jgi:hypothetical protein
MAYPIPRPQRYQLKVGRSTSGLGLFAAQEIPKGRFIIEYRGKTVSDEKAQKVGGRYLFDLGNGRNILGGTHRNTARYANHSCRPNCEARQIGRRVFLFSVKRIAEGDEITYNYGKEYFNTLIKSHGCRCEKCRR